MYGCNCNSTKTAPKNKNKSQKSKVKSQKSKDKKNDKNDIICIQLYPCMKMKAGLMKLMIFGTLYKRPQE